MPFILQGANGTAVNANSSNALLVSQTGTVTTTYDRRDASLDAFERLRVSIPHVEFEQTFTQTIPLTMWEQTAYGSGTYTQTSNNTGQLNTIANASGSGYWIQAYAPVRYAPGISNIFRWTFIFAPNVTGLTQRVGYYNDTTASGSGPGGTGDGLYIEAVNGVVNLVLRNYINSVATEYRIPQSSWSLDHMDGTGTSGVNINWTIAQHLVCEYQWLGVGTIRMGFNTPVGLVWAHEFISVNSFAQEYSRHGSFTCRAEIFTTTTGPGASSLQLINTTAIQERDGSQGRAFKYFNGNSGATAKTVGTTANTLFPLMALRAALTNDIIKKTTFIPMSVTINLLVVGTGTTSIQWAILAAPTPMTGATFAVSPSSSSFVTVDNAATATTAVTGTPIFGGIIPNVVGTYTFMLSDFPDNLIKANQNAAGNLTITGANVLTLAAGTLTGTTTVAPIFAASISWKETT